MLTQKNNGPAGLEELWLTRRMAALGAIAAVLFAAASCPGPPEPDAPPLSDPAQVAHAGVLDKSSDTPASQSRMIGSDGTDIIANAQPGQADSSVPNPRPDGDNWVWTPALTATYGGELAIEYAQAAGGGAWIGLVPEYVEDLTVESNLQQQVAMTTVAAGAGSITLPLTVAGRFRLRLFNHQGKDGAVLSSTPVITVRQPAPLAPSTAGPYITLNSGSDQEFAVQEGFPLIISYSFPPTCAEGAWLSVVPVNPNTTKADDALGAISTSLIAASEQGHFTWVAAQPGRYYLELKAAGDGSCFQRAVSPPFTVINRKQVPSVDAGL